MSTVDTIIDLMRQSPDVFNEIVAAIPAVQAAIEENQRVAAETAVRQAKEQEALSKLLKAEQAATDTAKAILAKPADGLSDEDVTFLTAWLEDIFESGRIGAYLGTPAGLAEQEAVLGRNRAAPLAILAGDRETAIRLCHRAVDREPPGHGDVLAAFAVCYFRVVEHAAKISTTPIGA
jgi:hypothetical protein